MAFLWLLVVGALLVNVGSQFVTTWRTTSTNQTITLPVPFPLVYPLFVDWGDATLEYWTSSPISHRYNTTGDYNVSIDGTIRGFRFNSQGDTSMLVDIVSWGEAFEIDRNSTYVFAGCTNLRISAPPNTQPVFLPNATLQGMFMNSSINSTLNWNLTNVISLSEMFSGATLMNQPINFTDTLGVLDVSSMFAFTPNFNQPVIFDTRNVNNMGFMFFQATAFNQSVNFDTGKVFGMPSMFAGASSFNQPVNFETRSVVVIARMFANASNFNQPLNFTTTDKVFTMYAMFQGATRFNQPVNFDTGSVIDMSAMFRDAPSFNQPVNFNTSSVQNMREMFYGAGSFNRSVNFDTSNVVGMERMFYGAWRFNQPVNFNTGKVTSMKEMFSGATSFNQPLNFSNTSNVTDMSAMFQLASSFNQSVDFDTRNVLNISRMFYHAANFNQPVNFATNKVTALTEMFANAVSFNQLVNFNTSRVTNMDSMFDLARSFNQPVNFDTRNVISMDYMFFRAQSFNQPLNFDLRSVVSMIFMFGGAQSFNQPLNFSNTANVSSITGLFQGAINFNQPINFDTRSVANMYYMFHNAISFNQPVNFNTSRVGNIRYMFCNATSFNQPVNFDLRNAVDMELMFANAVRFNQPVNFNPRSAQTLAGMFLNATSFNWPIGFQSSSLTTAAQMFEGATSFNQPVTLNAISLTDVSRMFANANKCFNSTVNISAFYQSPNRVFSVNEMFLGVDGFHQNLAGWNTNFVASCSRVCPQCGLPRFPLCFFNPCGNSPRILTLDNMSVCNLPQPCTYAPSSSPSPAPPLCQLVNVPESLQVQCLRSNSTGREGGGGTIISPLFNITQYDANNTNTTTFVFTLPIDPALYEVGKVTNQACDGQQLSCEWQDPNSFEFLQSGCAVSQERVDLGSGIVGTQCTCTHLTVFAIVLRPQLRVAPLCHAQEVDYALLALYGILACVLLFQTARIVHLKLYKSSLPQHLVLLLACVLRVVYLVLKPLIGSLWGLMLLGLLPSALALVLFIHLLLVWGSLQRATVQLSSPFSKFRKPFFAITLIVVLLVIVLTILVAVKPEVEVVQGGSYVFAALTGLVCLLVVLSGLGLRRSLGALSAPSSSSTSSSSTSASSSSSSSPPAWRDRVSHRILVVIVSLAVCLFVVACLWAAAVQTDILVSSAATLATSASFYFFDWLSLCVMTWLFSSAVQQAAAKKQQKQNATQS